VGLGVVSSWRRHGIGRSLVDHVAAFWAAQGITRIVVGPYVPAYVTPGVDEGAYPDAVTFLEELGFRTDSRPLSMRVLLTGYRPHGDAARLRQDLTAARVHIRPVLPADIVPLLEFLDRHFPHWRADATGVLQVIAGGDPAAVTMHVATERDEIVGFAQSRGERFGPFGVSEACRGRGVGAVLLSTTLTAMRAQGFHCAWFLWTTDRAARLYEKHGFAEVRRFAIMSREIVATPGQTLVDRSESVS
jgi:GNAT superfamily N-acetyltransferase